MYFLFQSFFLTSLLPTNLYPQEAYHLLQLYSHTKDLSSIAISHSRTLEPNRSTPQIAHHRENIITMGEKTGFFDLPLELREAIYEEMLPTDRTLTYPTTRPEEKALFAFCESQETIYEEVEPLIYKNCSCRLEVTPDKEMDIPVGIEFDRFQRIDIHIHHPEDYSSRDGIRQIICALSYGRPDQLPPVSVVFDEDKDEVADPVWTQEVPSNSAYCRSIFDYESDCEPGDDHLRGHSRGDDRDTWLRIDRSAPLVADILDRFLSLPPCQSFFVEPLSGLQMREPGLPRHDRERRIFDEEYMMDMMNALTLWMEGKRDIELASTESDYHEPRLERLAYEWYSEDYYCDGESDGSN
jgi:hypothetical protein